MIRISTANVETEMVLSDYSPLILIEENPCEFFKTVDSLNKAFSEDDSDFTFWDNDESLSPQKKGEILTDLFSFELTDKKIINLLYKKLQNNFLSGSYLVPFNEIIARTDNFLSDLFSTVDFSLDYNEFTLEDLLKTCSVKPAKTYDSLLEKIICYINVFASLKNICFFVFVNIKDVLPDEQLKQLYKHCSLHKISLFLIESQKKRPLLAEERAIIITEDLCEIVENFSDL